jgi:hypothetical protein
LGDYRRTLKIGYAETVTVMPHHCNNQANHLTEICRVGFAQKIEINWYFLACEAGVSIKPGAQAPG